MSKTFKNLLLIIRYPHFAPFLDMYMGKRISLVGFQIDRSEHNLNKIKAKPRFLGCGIKEKR